MTEGNDHLSFEILYTYQRVVGKYRPDFVIHLPSGDMLAPEAKGRNTEQSRARHRSLDE